MDPARATAKRMDVPALAFPLVAEMIGMFLQNRESTVKLFEQHDARKFMWQRHLSKRENDTSLPPRILGKAVAPANREQQGDCIDLFAFQHCRQFLGRILLAPRVE